MEKEHAMAIRELIAATPMAGMGDWTRIEEPVLADMKRQLAEHGLVFVKYLPNMFRFSAVVGNGDNTKWIHVTTDDVRQGPEWMDAIRLRRMSSERDWKGDAYHYCVLERLGEACREYMDDAYDDEVL